MGVYIKGLTVGVAFAIAGTAAVAAPTGHSYYAPDAIVSAHLDDDPFATFGTKWGAPLFGTPGGTVTYSYMADGVDCSGDGGGPCSSLGSFMPAGWEAVIDSAFAVWSAIADIDFMKVVDNGVPWNAPGAVGDIRIGGHAFDGAGGILAHGFFPPPNGVSAAGDIHFDIGDTWKIGFGGPGFDIFQVAAHEIGHAIGLEHTPVPGSLMNAFYTEAFSGPQADDIAGAQFIYGPRVVVPQVPVPAALPLLASALALFGVARRFGRA